MPVVQKNIVIYAELETIDEYVHYADTWPEWFPGIIDALPDSYYPAQDSTVELTFEAGGSTFNLLLAVLMYEGGEEITFEISGDATGTLTFYTTETGDESYEVTAYLDYELGTMAYEMADVEAVDEAVESHFEDALINLKDWVETGV